MPHWAFLGKIRDVFVRCWLVVWTRHEMTCTYERRSTCCVTHLVSVLRRLLQISESESRGSAPDARRGTRAVLLLKG